jgi:hypothetical protein
VTEEGHALQERGMIGVSSIHIRASIIESSELAIRIKIIYL